MGVARRFLAPAVAVVLTVALGAPARGADLPHDERIQTGTLANGVTWMYRQHDNPPGKMAIMFHVDTGSLNETNAQRGVAHFIEHMCFNGTEHYPPGELLKYFESIGMEFGADANAFTSFDQTAYMLFLPDTETEQIDKALMTLSDYVFRALLLPAEIDKERGIIMEEWRSGKSAAQRVNEKGLELVFAGSRFAERLPIGIPEVIEKAPPEQFENYYRTWYRPERLTVMCVGDAPVEKVLPALEKWVGAYQPEVPPGTERRAEFKLFSEARAFVITDPELAGCEVEMSNIAPGRPPVTTVEQYRTQLLENVGTWMVNRRLDERVQKGEASFRSAGTRVGDFFHDGVIASASAQGEPEDWSKMLSELVTEVVRGRLHGFSQRELDLAKKQLLSHAERAVQTEPTRAARRMLFEMNHAVEAREPILSAAQELEIMQKLLPTIELEEVFVAFTKHFAPDTFAFVVTMPEKEGVVVPTNEEVLATARAALGSKPDPMPEQETPTQLLAAEPTPGKVVETTVDSDLEITSAWLENGVRVHHRFMDYKKDQVLIGITLAGGRLEETKDNVGVTELVGWALQSQPATSRLTSTNVRDLMTGKKTHVRVGPTQDSLSIRVSGSPEDLESGLQLAHALLTDGKVEESAVKVWKQRQSQRLEMAQALPEYKAFEALMEEVSGGDPRLEVLLGEDNIAALDMGVAQAWFDRLCKEAPIEVAVVGELKLDEALRLVQKYIGSLPSRPRSAARLDALRELHRPTGPLVRHVDVTTVTPKAMAIAGFVGCEARQVDDTRALELAAEVLTSRLIKHVREELSLVYSLSAGNVPARAYRDAGMFVTQAPCDPGNARKVVDEVHAQFAAFAESGPTAEEFANAKKQIANNLDESMREPSYWLSVLDDFNYHDKNLEDEKNEKAAYEGYKAEDVVRVFKKYYTPQRSFSVTAVPTSAEETKTGPVGTTGADS